MFYYAVMGANARPCLRMKNEKNASKVEPPLEKLNLRILT